VQGKPAESGMPDIFSFLQEESADLSRYLQLQNTLSHPQKAFLLQLIQITRYCITILRGILSLQSGTLPKTMTYPLPKELPSASLKRLYGNTLRRSNHYSQWRADSVYGIAFTQLETQSHQRCLLILQLLGRESDK
jgi:hypothetical protein